MIVWEGRIRSRAAAIGIALQDESVRGLATHARAVLEARPELHLTSIHDPEEFLERHLGETFEGAALLPAEVEGVLVDLGSGNGYPGLPLAAARPGLRLVLAEASRRRAEFLREITVRAGFASAVVLEAQVQRAADLASLGAVRVLATRAAGAWPKIVPRLAAALAPDGQVLLWSGAELEAISRRAAWRKLRLEERRPLPLRDQSWVWRFRGTG